MAERIYPSSKPNPHPPQPLNGGGGAAAAANGGAGPSFPATKAQLYGAARPAYRPQPPRKPRRSRRGCCCSLCLWLTLLLLALVLLAAIAGGVFYVLYRPHRPSFSVSSLRLSSFNLTSSNLLSSRLDLSLTARNPNKKLSFVYDPTDVSVSTASGLLIGTGSIPAFVSGHKNTTLLKAVVSSSAQSVDKGSASDLRGKSSLPLEIKMETKAGVKVAGVKTKKIGIRVTCTGVSVAVPKGKAAGAAAAPDVSCKVKLRVKIWKWTV